jgi:hypothetical protein
MAMRKPQRLNFHAQGCCIEGRGRADGPPKVCPTVLKVGFAGPANLTAFSTAEVRARGSAPRRVWMTEPERKTMKVGILKNAVVSKIE